jgi:hypothetical protein
MRFLKVMFFALFLSVPVFAETHDCSCSDSRDLTGYVGVPEEQFALAIFSAVQCSQALPEEYANKLIGHLEAPDFIIAREEGCQCEGLDFDVVFITKEFRTDLLELLDACEALQGASLRVRMDRHDSFWWNNSQKAVNCRAQSELELRQYLKNIPDYAYRNFMSLCFHDQSLNPLCADYRAHFNNTKQVLFETCMDTFEV